MYFISKNKLPWSKCRAKDSRSRSCGSNPVSDEIFLAIFIFSDTLQILVRCMMHLSCTNLYHSRFKLSEWIKQNCNILIPLYGINCNKLHPTYMNNIFFQFSSFILYPFNTQCKFLSFISYCHLEVIEINDVCGSWWRCDMQHGCPLF